MWRKEEDREKKESVSLPKRIEKVMRKYLKQCEYVHPITVTAKKVADMLEREYVINEKS